MQPQRAQMEATGCKRVCGVTGPLLQVMQWVAAGG